MRIASVTATPFRIPVARTISPLTGVRSAAEHVLVRVETDDGVSGHAMRPAPDVVRRDVRDRAGRDRGRAGAVGVRHRGLGRAAPAGDADRRRDGQSDREGRDRARRLRRLRAHDGAPAHRLLGGDAHGDVACCPMLGYGAPAEVLEEAAICATATAWGRCKLKIGPDVENDVGSRALREGLGSASKLYPDANGRYAAADAMSFTTAPASCACAGSRSRSARTTLPAGAAWPTTPVHP